MDTYLSLHNFSSYLLLFRPLSLFHTCLHYSLCRGQFNYSIILCFTFFTMPGTFVRQTFLYFIINFIFLTLQILFTIMDIAHCYFTFDQNSICISIFFEKKCLKSLSSLVWQQIFPRRSYVYFLTRLHSLIYCSNVNCQ